MPDQPEVEEIDVTQLMEKLNVLEEKIRSQETRIKALEDREADAQRRLTECEESIDALALKLKGRL